MPFAASVPRSVVIKASIEHYRATPRASSKKNVVPPAVVAKVRRLAEITKFSAEAFAKTSLLTKGVVTSEEVGKWIVDESTRMGPLFVKIAQLVSARVDALDPALAVALSMVQDEVECEGTTRPMVAGYVVDDGDRPLKAGSIASVWLARRETDGKRVVIKKLHAGIRESFELDLPAIIMILRLATAVRIPGAENFYEIMRESEDMLYAETDLEKEAFYMRAFRKNLPAGVIVPEVIEGGHDYIVQEYVHSTKISRVRGPNPRLARKLLSVFVYSILETAVVHADPHPGNVGVLSDGTIVLYDFGACVTTRGIRGSLAKLLGAVAVGDTSALVAALIDVGAVDAKGSDAYRMVTVLEKLSRTPPDQFHVSLAEQPEFADGSGRRLVRFGTDTVYLLRALSLVEGTCRTLDPDFSYESYWKSDLEEIVTDALESGNDDMRGGNSLGNAVSGWARAVASMPDNSKRMLDATHQLNIELRDDLREMRRSFSNIAIGGGILFLVIFHYR